VQTTIYPGGCSLPKPHWTLNGKYFKLCLHYLSFNQAKGGEQWVKGHRQLQAIEMLFLT
jgi:hypothetical protein